MTDNYTMTVQKDEEPVPAKYPMSQWGKDHWSTFAYIETLCVDSIDGIGTPDHRRVQTNSNRHPALDGNAYNILPCRGEDYSIRLTGGKEIPGPDYDEWDCIDDMISEGLLLHVGTGINPAYRLTKKGTDIIGKLREWKVNGGMFGTFIYP